MKLEMKYLVIKLEDIEKHMDVEEQGNFWRIYWDMISRIEEIKNE